MGDIRKQWRGRYGERGRMRKSEYETDIVSTIYTASEKESCMQYRLILQCLIVVGATKVRSKVIP